MKNKKPKLQKVTKKINRTSSSQKKRNGKKSARIKKNGKNTRPKILKKPNNPPPNNSKQIGGILHTGGADGAGGAGEAGEAVEAARLEGVIKQFVTASGSGFEAKEKVEIETEINTFLENINELEPNIIEFPDGNTTRPVGHMEYDIDDKSITDTVKNKTYKFVEKKELLKNYPPPELIEKLINSKKLVKPVYVQDVFGDGRCLFLAIINSIYYITRKDNLGHYSGKDDGIVLEFKKILLDIMKYCLLEDDCDSDFKNRFEKFAIQGEYNPTNFNDFEHKYIKDRYYADIQFEGFLISNWFNFNIGYIDKSTTFPQINYIKHNTSYPNIILYHNSTNDHYVAIQDSQHILDTAEAVAVQTVAAEAMKSAKEKADAASAASTAAAAAAREGAAAAAAKTEGEKAAADVEVAKVAKAELFEVEKEELPEKLYVIAKDGPDLAKKIKVILNRKLDKGEFTTKTAGLFGLIKIGEPTLDPKEAATKLVHKDFDRGVLDYEGDVIVNAANENGTGGDGIDGALNDALGTTFKNERKEIMRKKRNKITIGEGYLMEKVTKDHSMPGIKAANVIHIVPPNANEPEYKVLDVFKQKLKETYKYAMELAKKKKYKKIGFSLLAGGLFRGKKNTIEDVIEFAINALRDYELNHYYQELEEIALVSHKQTPNESTKMDEEFKKFKKSLKTGAESRPI